MKFYLFICLSILFCLLVLLRPKYEVIQKEHIHEIFNNEKEAKKYAYLCQNFEIARPKVEFCVKKRYYVAGFFER
jgi:hypothetical protein